MLFTKRKKGALIENDAWRFLSKQGLVLCCKNFQCKMGEIDIIAKDQNTIVFVEVRYRSTNKFGYAFETVDSRKQTKIVKTALLYLTKHQNLQNYNYRFDIISASTYNGATQLQWHKNAYQPNTFI